MSSFLYHSKSQQDGFVPIGCLIVSDSLFLLLKMMSAA
jgi:hypothetical protein